MKYNVHIFTVVRVKVEGVEADSQEAAIGKAENSVPLFSAFDNMKIDGASDVESAEENAYFLVDEAGDEDYDNSKWYGPDKKPMKQDN